MLRFARLSGYFLQLCDFRKAIENSWWQTLHLIVRQIPKRKKTVIKMNLISETKLTSLLTLPALRYFLDLELLKSYLAWAFWSMSWGGL